MSNQIIAFNILLLVFFIKPFIRLVFSYEVKHLDFLGILLLISAITTFPSPGMVMLIFTLTGALYVPYVYVSIINWDEKTYVRQSGYWDIVKLLGLNIALVQYLENYKIILGYFN